MDGPIKCNNRSNSIKKSPKRLDKSSSQTLERRSNSPSPTKKPHKESKSPTEKHGHIRGNIDTKRPSNKTGSTAVLYTTRLPSAQSVITDKWGHPASPQTITSLFKSTTTTKPPTTTKCSTTKNEHADNRKNNNNSKEKTITRVDKNEQQKCKKKTTK